MLQNKRSLIAVLFIVVYIVSFPLLNGWSNPFTYDTFGYYLYLPMSFIYQDLGVLDFSVIENINKIQPVSDTIYQLNKMDTGYYLNRYPLGLAILLAPFYLLGHFFAGFTGYPTNGFSFPYQVSIIVGSIFYISASLFLLRKILLKWFSDIIVALTIVIVTFGTNYLVEATLSSTMPHVLLFFVYSLIILITIKWHSNKTIKNSTLLGGILGFAVICRPTEIVAILIPIFWGVVSFKELKLKIVENYQSNRKELIIVLSSFFAIIFIQLIYWKFVSGSFIINSYQNPGEGLDLHNPHLFNVLFSFKKGWLIYTPIMLFCFIGFYFLKKKKPQFFLSFFLYFTINLYLVSSWTVWWYAQGFSQRALVQSYFVMAIALAFFLDKLLKFKLLYKSISVVFLVFFFILCVFQTYQYKKGIIHNERMTYAYYKEVFGKTAINTEEIEHLLSFNRNLDFYQANENYSYQKEVIYSEDFENKEKSKQIITGNESNKFLKMGGSVGEIYVNVYNKKYYELTNTEYIWLEVSFDAYVLDSNSKTRLVMNMNRHGEGYKYKAYDLVDIGASTGEWKRCTARYLTPVIRSLKDKFQTYFWYDKGEDVLIDNIEIAVYKPID